MTLALDVLLRGGEARPGKIIRLALQSCFRIEKVLCSGIPYLLFIIVDFPILRRFLLKVMQCGPDHLISFLTLADLGPNWVEKLLARAMQSWGLRHLSIDRAGHVCNHDSSELVIVAVLHP